ncbi:hypothetical protein [Mucilaginibacter panaciglaebae]|uniref:Uncharacterized protein n=1 Tax=Mucilaginibacter panaciglaebae TaxID=502331 RepID=A0ABP7WY55_9SPHI
MKRFVFFLVLFFTSRQFLHAQTLNPNYLKDAYRKGFVVPNKDSIYYQRLFFKALPSNFKTFFSYYGWDEKKQMGRPLTGVPPNYFKRIFNSTAYSQLAVIKKIIEISINGIYCPDAIGSFQRSSYEFAEAHNAQFVNELNAFSKPEIVSMWKFYFDYPSSFVRRSVYSKLCKVTALNNRRMVPLITEGYEKAVAKWATHH